MIGEHVIDGGKHGRHGAERQVERHAAPGEAGVARHVGEGSAHGVELREVGALEAVDRLLLVADDEQGAHLAARAGVVEELRGQRVDDLPLLGAGVLRLVDEDVVDAAVELEHAPTRRALAR